MDRVKALTRHLTSASPSNTQGAMDGPLNESTGLGSKEYIKMFGKLKNQLPKEGEYNIADHLPGPLNDKETYPRGWMDVFEDLRDAQQRGYTQLKYVEWQKKYGGKQGLAANIVIPELIFKRSDGDVGSRSMPEVTQEVIINNPEDCARIARVHVQKQPNFNLFFYGSIISTIDNDKWRDQRDHLEPAFLPKASLEKIFPVSLNRAKTCAKRMEELIQQGDGVVDLHEFMLHETEAQLQLALFGVDEEFMERTNQPFRYSMTGRADPGIVRPFCRELVDSWRSGDKHGPSEGCPVKGPLSARLASLNADKKTDEGNALIFAFAGHDTTANTLTFLCHELSRNPHVMKKLQKEIDDFVAELNGREMVYDDCQKLKYLTRCVTETLRLYPAVANGTFREIQFDDYITGPNGEDVLVKKGTYVRILNWSRHRNPDLWGDDVMEFNPDRDFQASEIYFDEGLRAYNPATPRYSPFTFSPRSCIGKNFSMMEMRAILVQLLSKFEFVPLEEYKNVDKDIIGVNYGTLAPRHLLQPELVDVQPGWTPPKRTPSGLPIKVVPRRK